MKTKCVFAVAGAALLFGAGEARAQDSHYWTLQFGPRASLLGGAVIGSISDVSGTFYNPGALSQAENLSFALSISVFERASFRLEDGGGEGVDLGTSRSGLRPSMVAGTIKRDLFGAGVLAYSAITRNKGSHDLQGLTALSGEEVPPDVDADDLVGVARFQGEFQDFWAGLTYSHALGSHVGLGATWYGAIRSQTRRSEWVAESVGTDGSGAVRLDFRGGNYSTIRTLFKIGAFAKGKRITGGLTLTTPSIHISGSGELGLNTGAFGSDTTALAMSTQTDLDAEYRTPLSVGAGVAVRVGNARLHGSAEWYDAIEPYTVMQGEPFFAQEPENELVQVDAVQALDEVLNWAVALEYTFTPKFSGFASYYTDYSGLTDQVERSNLNGLPIDIRTVNLGANFSVGRTRLTLAGGYGRGRQVDRELTELLRENDEDFEATYIYDNLRFLFGFEVGVD
jgi:hypothetical protein